MAPDPYEDARALHHAGELERAAELYRRAVEAEPSHFRALNNLGSVCEALGQAGEAERHYRGAVAIAPESAIVVYNLARLLHLGGRLDEAEVNYRRSLGLDPERADTHFNLGRLLQERDRSSEAEVPLRRAVSLTPDAAAAHGTLGDALFAQRRLHEALEAYRRAQELEPDDAPAAYDVAKTLEALARGDEAVACYRRSLELAPDSGAAREGLARALQAAGRHEEALASLREWLAHEPGSALAAHLLASLGGAEAPERASDGYVRDTFDRFATDFDRTLERLQYRAPRLCAAQVALVLGEPRGDRAVLDAGCGTGLCAPLLKPWASRLDGVDLSPGMLARARERGIYDELAEAELTAFLLENPGRWDLVVSADTLCYLGALESPLAAAFAALREGGWLVFTLEHDDGAGTYGLQASGRYVHAAGYAFEAMSAAGFADVTLAHGALRMEGGSPVDGMIVSGRRAG